MKADVLHEYRKHLISLAIAREMQPIDELVLYLKDETWIVNN